MEDMRPLNSLSHRVARRCPPSRCRSLEVFCDCSCVGRPQTTTCTFCSFECGETADSSVHSLFKRRQTADSAFVAIVALVSVLCCTSMPANVVADLRCSAKAHNFALGRGEFFIIMLPSAKYSHAAMLPVTCNCLALPP